MTEGNNDILSVQTDVWYNVDQKWEMESKERLTARTVEIRIIQGEEVYTLISEYQWDVLQCSWQY